MPPPVRTTDDDADSDARLATLDEIGEGDDDCLSAELGAEGDLGVRDGDALALFELSAAATAAAAP